MDSWPIDYRTGVTPLGRGGRRRIKEQESPRNYPDVKLGSLNAVTLFEKDNRLEWTSVLGNTLPNSKRHHDRSIKTIFPPTRPPRLAIRQTTIFQRAEQGANFLRTYLPDIDVPAELIRGEISRDAENWKRFRTFDPYVGNLLEHVPYDSETAFLAFPMGELNRDLNLSNIHYLERREISFSPNTSPVRSFRTPMQQIVSSKCIPDHIEQNSYLAVRTFQQTSVLKVATSDTSKKSAQVAELVSIVPKDTDNRVIVDIKLIPSPFATLAVTDNGTLYKLHIADERKAISVVRPAVSAETELTHDGFWRIALGEDGVDCLLASSKDVKLQDFRSRASLHLFAMPGKQGVLTSIDHGGDNFVQLCSTRDIVWIDKRYPSKPLMAYQHGRQYDRSLEARTVQFQSRRCYSIFFPSPTKFPLELTLLTSRNNVLVTVYDVSRSVGQLVHMNNLPYCLFPDNGIGASCIGSVSLQHSQHSNGNVCLFRLSDEGSLHYMDLGLNEDSVVNTSWSPDVKELDAQKFSPDIGPFDAQAFSETDFRLPYDAIFRVHAEEQSNAEKESGEAVYDLLDRIPDFWQNSDVPIEHMLTTFDAAFRSGPQPTQASRADFLTQSIINSKRGYRAVLQDSLSARCLMKGASWHYNINPTIKRLGLNITNDIRSCTEALHEYDLMTDPDRNTRSFAWENEAREQLALDLVLSGDVFSDRPFSTFPDGNLELEVMTKTLSLAGETPGVDFGYLRPILRRSADYYCTTTEEDEVRSFDGVRALLRDWVVGTDPRFPSVRDHSVGTRLSDSSPADEAVRNTKKSQGIHLFSSQRPPLVVASSVAPPGQTEGSKRGFRADQSPPPVHLPVDSQPILNGSDLAVPSQDCMASTQILPGPYGGRVLGKKKTAKKRLGGF